MIKELLTVAAALSLLGCASEPTREGEGKEQSSYTTGSNIARRDKSSVQKTERYKKDPVTDAMGEDYGKGQPIQGK